MSKSSNSSQGKQSTARKHRSLKSLSPNGHSYCFDDFGPLLRKIRQARRKERWATQVHLDLISYLKDFDMAMIVSQAVYWDDLDSKGERRARFTAKDYNDDALEDEEGQPLVEGWLVDKDNPASTLGIPWRRFWRLVHVLEKMKLISCGPPYRWKTSPNGAVAPAWRRQERRCVLKLINRDTIEEYLDKNQDGPGYAEKTTISMPWAWRAAMCNRRSPSQVKHWNPEKMKSVKAKGVRDIEDGHGAHLLLRLMKFHTMNKETGEPNCNRVRVGKVWSGATRKEWAENLRLRNEEHFDRIVESMPALVKRRRGWCVVRNGHEQHFQETQLRPLIEAIRTRWRKYGAFRSSVPT